MRRREFLTATIVLAMPSGVLAQERVFRVGWLTAGPRKRPPKNQFIAVFVAEMQRLGLVEERDFTIEWQGVEGHFEHVDNALGKLGKVDVIISGADRITRRLKPLVKSTPVVFVSFDPVREGFVDSLARPGGNITGVSLSAGPQLEAKRLEILKEILPSARRIAFLGAAFEWQNQYSGVAVRAAARSLGLEVFQVDCGETKEQVTSGLQRLARARPDGAFVPSGVTMFTFRKEIAEFLRQHHIPAAFGIAESVVAGGLMSYGPDTDEYSRVLAHFIARILRGGNPTTMPVEQPSVFRLAVNLQAARELGITVPPSVLVRADQVIE